jgi:predicted Fe-Mo cluster-binding NifX family protein
LSECNRILVYQLSRDDSALIAERHFARQETARSSELMVQRIALIADCNVVFASMIGAKSVPLLVKAGVHPLTCQRGDRAPHLLESLQGVLRDGTPPWLVKRMDCSHRFGDETLACAA